MTRRRAVTAAIVAVAALVVGVGAYLQWWHGPSFEKRFEAIRTADFVVNTAYTLDADSPDAAAGQGSGEVRASFHGPDETDVIVMTLYADTADAEPAFERLRTTATHPELPVGGFFDSNGGFCDHAGNAYSCSARFGDTIVRGIATAGAGDDVERTMDNAQGLLQAGVKNLYEVRLDLDKGSHPFVFALIAAGLLLLISATWRAIASPRAPLPAAG